MARSGTEERKVNASESTEVPEDSEHGKWAMKVGLNLFHIDGRF